ncbi:glycosyltransferase family 4 protein [Planctomycetaceae bacterium SH139]
MDSKKAQKCRVVGYLQPNRGGGVARHARMMIEGLASHPLFSVSAMASKQEMVRAGNADWIQSFQLNTHPFPQKLLERSWKAFGLPPASWLFEATDWIYSPAEVRLPRAKCKTAVTIHDVQALETDLPWSQSDAHVKFARKWRAWLQKLFAESDLLLTVSEFSKSRLVELADAPAEKIVVVGNGVDEVFFSDPIEFQSADLDLNPHVVIIGGLRTKKGASQLVELATRFERENRRIRFDVVGQNDPEWEQIAADIPSICLHGWLGDYEVRELLQDAIALLFLSPYEGFGIPALEAMAAGCPVIAANRASLPEVVGDGGVLVEPEDICQVMEEIDQFMQDISHRKRFQQVGWQRASHYRWSGCVNRLADALRAST